MHQKISSAKRRQFCPGGDELTATSDASCSIDELAIVSAVQSMKNDDVMPWKRVPQ